MLGMHGYKAICIFGHKDWKHLLIAWCEFHPL